MKDMTVEELLDDLCFYADLSDEHYAIEAELLRRFEDLKDIGVERDNAFVAYESLKCCGNCKWRRFTLMGNYCHEYCSVDVLESSGYCNQWQTDSLSRAERESK